MKNKLLLAILTLVGTQAFASNPALTAIASCKTKIGSTNKVIVIYADYKIGGNIGQQGAIALGTDQGASLVTNVDMAANAAGDHVSANLVVDGFKMQIEFDVVKMTADVTTGVGTLISNKRSYDCTQ